MSINITWDDEAVFSYILYIYDDDTDYFFFSFYFFLL